MESKIREILIKLVDSGNHYFDEKRYDKAEKQITALIKECQLEKQTILEDYEKQKKLSESQRSFIRGYNMAVVEQKENYREKGIDLK